jgi:23S rRNA pseudouridine2605 synthase
MTRVRLHVAIAHSGLASRRKAEGLIQSGHVIVNGQRVTTLGTTVDQSTDQILVDGTPLPAPAIVYYALNKPVGTVCALSSARREPLVTDLVPADPPVVPVGRLDKRSSGLMILTNDGAFAHALTHPRFEHEKEYELIVRCPSIEALPLALERLARGVRVNRPAGRHGYERQTFDHFTLVSQRGPQAQLRVVLHTGKKRQIRRMAAAVGLTVDELVRIRIGQLTLGRLKLGEWRRIKPGDVVAPMVVGNKSVVG